MFKKFLCWLLIFQHINVYVLHANSHDFSIQFYEERVEKNKSLFRLKLSQNIEDGKEKKIYDVPFVIEQSVDKKLKYYAPDTPKGVRGDLDHGRIIKGDYQLWIDDKGEINLFSKQLKNEFSMRFSLDGLVNLGQFKTNRYISIETFGLIRTNKDIDSSGLKLCGKDFHNNWNIKADYLDILLSKTLDPTKTSGKSLKTSRRNGYREIINGPEGSITINKKSNIEARTFINQGKIVGKDLAEVELNGTNLENLGISDTSQIMWDGKFSIKGIGKLTNKALIQPRNQSQNSSLSLDARSIHNLGN